LKVRAWLREEGEGWEIFFAENEKRDVL